MILRHILKSKINKAVVSEKKLQYKGSIGIDEAYLKHADILSGERVQVLNYNNGARIETYVIPEKKGSKKIVLYGPAARCGEIGDKICILSYLLISDDEAKRVKPILINL